MWRALRWSAWLVVLSLFLGGDGTALQSLALSLSQAALACGDTAAARAQLIGIGANVSATLVTASLGAISTSQNLAAKARSGVDVVNVSATRQNHHAIANNPSEMAAYLSADSVLGKQPVLHGLVMQCATNRFLFHAGTYAAVHCRARVMKRGHLVLAAVISTALFDARWVNQV